MTLWPDMETVALADVERINLAIRHFGSPHAVSVGTRGFTLLFEPCRARYPLRVSGVAGQAPFSAGCDAGALLPELTPLVTEARGDAALLHVADALSDWLCALEGLFGFTIELTGVAFDGFPEQGAYGLAVTHTTSGRTAHFSFCSPAVDEWLRLRIPPAPSRNALLSRLYIRLPVCMPGPWLSLPRLRRIAVGDALLFDRDSTYLRVPLRVGTCRILFQFTKEYTVIDRVMTDETQPVEVTSELLPIDSITFAFEAVLGTLSLSVAELAHLREGSIVAFRLPARERKVTLLCQGIPFARGELIDIEGAMGVRVTRLTQEDLPA
ncbi:flagellar motor switch/type III secretory pathway protein [Burkholderia sp. Ch1-1]|uniref:Type III secretory pathway protein HrcQb, FliN like n=1 Tax=Paraburkholderia dioscoreae TaxID=2604047 RepID=A0A5Q4ZEH3_9BURK|nr:MULTISPECIES: FliM/FliN family flagellar motor switch protein [Paraburkholderia]EIF32301.1 flagellar motor switch/type III secretory pathway protein [Burkholderia sp. Ch1-1]MDR8402045.1 FliM/FliN family flagellar motor switch protein [Paraburkholderia sp. USG1]VVD27876.1 Putative type III secretory pathway protein HrcQb, FliN like [Paraburkholderia dioscoreae]